MIPFDRITGRFFAIGKGTNVHLLCCFLKHADDGNSLEFEVINGGWRGWYCREGNVLCTFTGETLPGEVIWQGDTYPHRHDEDGRLTRNYNSAIPAIEQLLNDGWTWEMAEPTYGRENGVSHDEEIPF